MLEPPFTRIVLNSEIKSNDVWKCATEFDYYAVDYPNQ